ncbi:MAG: hypothetical protein V9G04_15080 [Nocardioides sp.]
MIRINTARISAAALGLTLAVSLTACGADSEPVKTSPGASTSTTAPIVTRGYSFPAGMIDGGLVPDGPFKGKLFSRIEGTITMPPGDGPHPVAMLVHGSYPVCISAKDNKVIGTGANTVAWPEACADMAQPGNPLSSGHDYVRSSASFGYIAQELARRGIATVALDVNVKETWWSGEPDARAAQKALLQIHRSLVEDFNAGKDHGIDWAGDLKGRFDLDKLALVGHSSGGGYVLAEMLGKEPIEGLDAVVAIQPADNSGLPKDSAPVPTLTIAGECDEQVGATGPGELAQQVAKGKAGNPVVELMLGHTTHIGVVGAGDGDPSLGMVYSVDSPNCKPAKLAAPGAMQAVTADATATFLADIFAGRTKFEFNPAPGVPVTTKALQGAEVSVSKTSLTPVVNDPQAIKFTESEDEIVPPLPNGVKLIHESGANGGDV